MSREEYIISDTHFHHTNMVKGCSKWRDTSGCRDFDTLELHDQTIVDCINKTVKRDDVLHHLGDWSFGGVDKILKFRLALDIEEIHLILGNHDHHIANNKNIIIEDHQWNDLERLGLHEYVNQEDGNSVIPAQMLFTSVKYYDEVKIYGHTYVLSHYPFRSWHNGHKSYIHCYGHCHNSLPDYYPPPEIEKIENGMVYYKPQPEQPPFKTMDVGIESAINILGSPSPFSFKEIQKIMQKREQCRVDHHV